MTDRHHASDRCDLLLVDDRPENLIALAAILEPLGQNLVQATSGEAALRCLLEREFAVILLDVQMPGLNGFETARLIKARERTKYVPIIFLTAINMDAEFVFEGYLVGAVDYIAKPYQPAILRSKVSVFVDLHLQRRRLAEQEQALRDGERQTLELEHMRERAESLAATTAKVQSLNEELNRRQAVLERAMAARSRFYASMSHELRTPINAVLGYSTLLLENIYGPLNEKQAEGIQRTHRAAYHLNELVDDVLDLSKIEAGKIDLKLRPIEFPSLIEEFFVTVRPLADEHKSVLTLEFSGDPVCVVSDPRRVRQILLNLLSNAIKFGRGNPIEVRCARTPEGGVVVEVTDHGDGVPTEDQERIFEEFVQLDTTPFRNGTGLGLSISRRLAVILQGSLTLESIKGEGSTFRLELPRAIDEPVGQFDGQSARGEGREKADP